MSDDTFEYTFASTKIPCKVRLVESHNGNKYPTGMAAAEALRFGNWGPVYVPLSAIPNHLRDQANKNYAKYGKT